MLLIAVVLMVAMVMVVTLKVMLAVVLVMIMELLGPNLILQCRLSHWWMFPSLLRGSIFRLIRFNPNQLVCLFCVVLRALEQKGYCANIYDKPEQKVEWSG